MKDIYKQKQFTLSLDVIPHKKQVKKRAETIIHLQRENNINLRGEKKTPAIHIQRPRRYNRW